VGNLDLDFKSFILRNKQFNFLQYSKRDIWVDWRWGAGTSSVKPSLEGKTWILPRTQPLTQMTALPWGENLLAEQSALAGGGKR